MFDSIIGRGSAGSKIAKNFTKYNEYDIYCIDDKKHDGADSFVMPKFKTPEEYENFFPEDEMQVFLKNAKNSLLIILTLRVDLPC